MVVLLFGIPLQRYIFIFAYFVKFYWKGGGGDECHIFLRGEENFSATPCRNFFHAMHQEGCKRNLDAASIVIDHVN